MTGAIGDRQVIPVPQGKDRAGIRTGFISHNGAQKASWYTAANRSVRW